MNIHFQQAETKSKGFSYILAALSVCTVMLMILNISRQTELHLSTPSSTKQGVYMESSGMPVAIPAPLPPVEQLQAIATPTPSSTPSPLPQAVPVPVPDLP